MFWNRSAETEKKLKQINEVLIKSFANVKRDTSNIFQWLNYFYRRNVEQEQRIQKMHLELAYLPKTKEQVRLIIDEYYSIGSIIGKIKELNEKIDDLSKRAVKTEHGYLPDEEILSRVTLSNIEKRVERLEQKRMSIKENVIRRLTRNAKEYVKSVIITYVRKYERISALQLKEMIVDEQNMCSKSSFYRLLEEIEQMDEIGFIKHGKEKHYISKAMKHVG